MGKVQLTDYMASGEANSPKQFTIDELKGKKAADLPRYFILKDAVVSNFAGIESSLQTRKSKVNLSKTSITPVYSTQDIAVPDFNPKEVPVTIFLSEMNIAAESKEAEDTSFFKKPMSIEVKNDDSELSTEEINLFKEQLVNVAPNAFKLTKGIDKPSIWSLVGGIVCLLLAGLLARSLYRAFTTKSEASE